MLSSQLDELEDGPLINTHVQTYQVARSLVEAGLGMAVVDPFTALVHASALQVRELQPSITVTLYALSRSSAGLHPAASALIRQMAEQARQLLQR